jgi:Na+-driven multidrug efflux pump
MVTSLITLWIIRIPLAYWLSGELGRTGIWWAIGLSIALGMVATYIYYKGGHWKKRCLIDHGKK